ncbi:hypothetical protein BR1R5_35670 [Pseudomonas sp. BR1R-5]|jgi:DNA-binding transcriptional LysR family regulator|uniref:LysR family transcriptional regulator n=1 Tax=Pseudomonas putida TaxID=303 RepID=A0A379KKJ0_PSEPU|nr:MULTISPECIES: LysR family transcriptional regulator [Pseudomonas]MBG6126194.1 DNA-binding transcriptional LysR family regulator [Pseudomonas sp. M2]MBM7397857.1 DNA-binding transcriptional LysR family regulator [Pseudomonas sp. M5]GLH34178.1 hypothetical protein BR1R5_35670 [Pseudomonas sp. BR1R-5]SUD67984.1 LysR family transcriptional regulator [Pseudomonas putida]
MLHSNYLKQLDLQDIVVFLNLLELRSAKRTAELMSVSQPTVSYCLKRLRGCFDDTLFASSQGVLLPTTKAEKIAPYLRMVMTAKDKPIATVVGNNVGQLKAGAPIAVAVPLASSYVVAGPKRG